MRKLPLILVLGALIAFPQYAFAQANSGIDQYQENIPGAGGHSPAGGGGGGSGSGGGGGGSGSESADPVSAGSGNAPVPAHTADAGKAPESGAGRVDVAKSDASGSRQNKGRGEDENVTSVAAEGTGRADPATTVEDTAGDGGMGVILPIILGASALAALVVLMARRRRGSAHAPPA